MSSTSKGMLALLRDLMAHEPRAQGEPNGASGLRHAPSGRPIARHDGAAEDIVLFSQP